MASRFHWSLILLLAFGASRADDPDALKKSFDTDVKPFLESYCSRCHNVDKMTSGVRVDHLDASLDDRHRKTWEAVLKQSHDKAMPPKSAKQPTDGERKLAVAWMERALAIARSRPTPKNGGARRMTVAQYRNTLRELLLLEDNVAEILPPDAVSKDGFVNNVETLQLSPLLLETYFEIAEQALSASLVDPTAKPTIQNFQVALGSGINPRVNESLVLGADSLLLKSTDYRTEELKPAKPFPYAPFAMKTKHRFIEGYQGNDTVRGWRDFDGYQHSVFACMRGTRGYPKGRAFDTIPQGLLLRPAIPSSEIFDVDSTYGPKANFKIALRELPDHGRFRVTVTAAKYDDGLLLDGKEPTRETAESVTIGDFQKPRLVTIPKAGIYRIDVHATNPKSPPDLTLMLGDRLFSGKPTQAAFLAVRLPAGVLTVSVQPTHAQIERIVMTPLALEHDIARRFVAFEKRVPHVGVHMGFRRDCGSTLAPVGEPRPVPGTRFAKFVIEGAIRNFPDPNVEKDNVNYLAGIREIGVRSEYTDGRDLPRLLIQSVEFEGPLVDDWPPASHRAIIPNDAKELPDDARKIICDFATRAYRRPISPGEEATLVGVFEKSRKDSANFRESIRDALLVALTSPQFLFLTETSKTPEAEPLDEYELASKLSYFLWNGPPDAATRKLAAAGQLSKRLDAEVERMVADPKFERFVEEFASQWLALDKFAVVEPDRKRFPKLTRDTRTELKREPIRFLEHLMRNNLPARNLIASDFVLANEVVASYYGLGDKAESGFRFEPIRHGRNDLGGILTQPAILAGLSDGREPNPVKRGAWLARRIVAEPPDDPPPNVPTLKEDTKHLTLRERLEKHRNQPGCTQCHAKIDPWGVPFEEFDAGGLFRTARVEARSILPDKTEVADFAGLRKHLADERMDQVAFCVLKHLATYATGRTLSHNELEFLMKDGVSLKADGYRMKDLIRYVVRSKIFLEK